MDGRAWAARWIANNQDYVAEKRRHWPPGTMLGFMRPIRSAEDQDWIMRPMTGEPRAEQSDVWDVVVVPFPTLRRL